MKFREQNRIFDRMNYTATTDPGKATQFRRNTHALRHYVNRQRSRVPRILLIVDVEPHNTDTAPNICKLFGTIGSQRIKIVRSHAVMSPQ